MVDSASYTLSCITWTCWVTLLLICSLLISCLDSEEFIEGSYRAYHADEVYFEAPDLSGGIEGVDYIIAYGADDIEEEEVET